jgi:hypothetical protein
LEAGCLQRRRQRGRRAGPVSRSASPPRGTTRPRPARRAQPTRPASPETSNRLATEPRKSFQEIPQEGSAVPLLGQPFRRAVRLEALQRRRLERRRQRRPQAGTVSRSATRRGVLRRSPLAARRSPLAARRSRSPLALAARARRSRSPLALAAPSPPARRHQRHATGLARNCGILFRRYLKKVPQFRVRASPPEGRSEPEALQRRAALSANTTNVERKPRHEARKTEGSTARPPPPPTAHRPPPAALARRRRHRRHATGLARNCGILFRKDLKKVPQFRAKDRSPQGRSGCRR